MQGIHDFEERILPDWWHQSSRALKIILAALALCVVAFIQAFPHLSAIAGIAILLILIVAAAIKWSVQQLR